MTMLLNRRLILLGSGPLVLAACSTEPTRGPRPSFYQDLSLPGTSVDVPKAADMISGYRLNNGRGPLTVNPRLIEVAAAHAQSMASADQVSSGDGVMARLGRAGIKPARAVENVSAGYLTLAEAFSGWRDSPPHKANMLDPAVTQLGLAIATRPGSKYRVFWCLILTNG
jgi:uncharacterized protein YkwD